MKVYVDKSSIVAEIERLKTIYNDDENIHHIAKYNILVDILSFLDTLEVKEMEKQGETYTKRDVADLNEFVKEYSFNIPSDIYNLLPKEKQSTWINEIENAIKAGAQWAEKQGEQKSIEWDEYDEMYVSALIAIVGKDGVTGKNLRNELIGWLKCLKGRFLKR